MAAIPSLQQILAELSPLPLAEGTVTAYAEGWTKAYYYDPITNTRITFQNMPTVVAIALAREGQPPKVAAPTISIPTIALPTALAITLPPLPEVTIPDPTADIDALLVALGNMQGFQFTGGIAFGWLISQLNNFMGVFRIAIQNLMTVVNDVGVAILQARQNLQAFINSVSQLPGNIQNSINSALASVQANAQNALNSFANFIQTGVNQGLSQVIPALYDQIGVPLNQLLTAVQIRNVQIDSFEFYALSPGYTIQYVAVGIKL
jgi:hypothetical protein